MSSKEEKDEMEKAADFLVESMLTQGVAASTVQDGHLLLFTRKWLESLLASHPTKKEFSIFLKRPDFKN